MSTDTTTPQGSELDVIAASLLSDAPETQEDDETSLVLTADAEAGEPEEQEDAGDEPVTDDEADEDDGEEAPADTGLITVKVNGEEVAVTLDDLKRSYSGQAYIQQGMQQVAEAKKAFASEVQALRTERQALAETLGQYRQVLERNGPPPPDKALLHSDPLRFHREKVEYEEYQAELQRSAQEQQAIMQAEYQARLAEHQRIVQEGRAALARAIPDLGNPEKAPAITAALIETGTGYGFDPEEIASAIDPRLIYALNDLREYRALKARMKGVNVKEKTREALPYTKPGAQRTEVDVRSTKVKQARSQMKRTGSVDDVARFLLTR